MCEVVGHIPLSEGWTGVCTIKLKEDVVTPGAGYAWGPCAGPQRGPALGVSDIIKPLIVRIWV